MIFHRLPRTDALTSPMNIETLVPHRGLMLLISEIIAIESLNQFKYDNFREVQGVAKHEVNLRVAL